MRKWVPVMIVATLVSCISGAGRSPLNKFALRDNPQDSFSSSEEGSSFPSDSRLQKLREDFLALQKKQQQKGQVSPTDSSDKGLSSEVSSGSGEASFKKMSRSSSSMSLSPNILSKCSRVVSNLTVDKRTRLMDERAFQELQTKKKTFKNLSTEYESVKLLDQESHACIARLRDVLFGAQPRTFHRTKTVEQEMEAVLAPINYLRNKKMVMYEELFVQANKKTSTYDDRVNVTMIAAAYRFDLRGALQRRGVLLDEDVCASAGKASRFVSKVRISVQGPNAHMFREREENKDFLLDPNSFEMSESIMQDAVVNLVRFIEKIEDFYRSRADETDVRNYCTSRHDAIRSACMLTQDMLVELAGTIRMKIGEEDGEYQYFKALERYKNIPLIAVLLCMPGMGVFESKYPRIL